MSSLFADLQRVIASQADEVPERFKTMQQLADAEGKPRDWMKGAMKKLKDAGLWEEKRFRIITTAGLREVPHYARKS